MENRTLYYFRELCQIPRGSGNEKEVSNYIFKWAAKQGLLVGQDSVYNVMIKKEASLGYESASPVLLQAHLDMVCEKRTDSLHDFSKDPIPWAVDGDWIHSAVGTSLGADCGIGVALIMSVLEDKSLVHPPIEVLLTVREETDMEGAYCADSAFFHAKRMINLDIGQAGRILAGSCGGLALEMDLPVNKDVVQEGYNVLSITIDGLLGGHSGADIHRGRGSAVNLAFRLLELLYKEETSVGLIEMHGGTSRLSIPRTAKLIVTYPFAVATRIAEICSDFEKSISEQYETVSLSYMDSDCLADDNLTQPQTAFLGAELEKIIAAGILFPCGIQEMSNLIDGSVESSSNLGIVELNATCLRLVEEIRSVYPATRELLVTKARLLAGLLGGDFVTHSNYPEWRFNKNSPLREKIKQLSEECIGTEMETYTAHTGNEIGILAAVLSLSDAVAIGPERCYFHTPDEKLSISSTLKYETFLKKILAELL